MHSPLIAPNVTYILLYFLLEWLSVKKFPFVMLDKPARNPGEDEETLCVGFASYWHWTQRSDCEPGNLSISYWQLSRIYAVLDQAENARRYGERCLEVSQGEGMLPFHLGYAYEALARRERGRGCP